MSSHSHSSSPIHAWDGALTRSHSWPAIGPTACGGKCYGRTIDEAVLRMRRSVEPLSNLYRGAGMCLLTIVYEAAARAPYKRIPALLDEQRCPLCDGDAPLRSFLWDGSAPSHLLPWNDEVAEVVLTVLSQLHMKAQEVVIAVAILEALRERHHAILQARSARPIFLAACVLARKLASDKDVCTKECYEAVADCFTRLSPLLLARAEEQLLELLEWRFPMEREQYELYACALVRAGLPPGVAMTADLVPSLY